MAEIGAWGLTVGGAQSITVMLCAESDISDVSLSTQTVTVTLWQLSR